MRNELNPPTLPDRLLWALLLGVSTGVATFVAARLAEAGWRRVRGVDPPSPFGIMRALGHGLGTRAVESLLTR